MDKIINFLLYGGFTKQEFISVEDDMYKSNKMSLLNFSFLGIVITGLLALASFFWNSITENRFVYVYAFISFLAILFLSIRKTRSGKSITALIYAFTFVTYLIGILLGTLLDSRNLGAIFITMLLVVPILFVDSPLRPISVEVMSAVIFAVMSMHYKDIEVYRGDLVNVLTCMVLSIFVSSYMNRVKIERFLAIQRAEMLSQTDILTGLKNRNHFEQMTERYYDLCSESLSVLYLDINGLHEMNNNHGHEAGDTMLKTIAAELQKAYGFKDCYRIGGDEYVAFGVDDTEDAIRNKAENLNKVIREKGYYVSIGYAFSKKSDLDIADLTKKAETMMYIVKEKFYAEGGNELVGRKSLR